MRSRNRLSINFAEMERDIRQNELVKNVCVEGDTLKPKLDSHFV